MSSIEPFNPRELLRFRYDLDIPSFLETGVAHNLNKSAGVRSRKYTIFYRYIPPTGCGKRRKTGLKCAKSVSSNLDYLYGGLRMEG